MPNVAEILENKKLLRGTDHVDAAEALEGKKYTLLYFSASWCPPCRVFTPQLTEFYNKHKERLGLEIVFVASDKTTDAFRQYYEKMPWLALPFEHRDLQNRLSTTYGVSSIPFAVLLETENGTVVTSNARNEVVKDKDGVNFPWAGVPNVKSSTSTNAGQEEKKEGCCTIC